MTKQMKRAVYLLFCAGHMAAAGNLAIKIDVEQIKETSAKVKLAAQDGDSQAVLVNGRRMLELIPNEPAIQAPIYLLLSQAYRIQGDDKKAEDYLHIARKLDPKVESHVGPGRAAGTTRADYSGAIQTTAGTVGAIVSQIEQIRIMKLCLEMSKRKMPLPPVCGTPNGAPGSFPGAPGGAAPPFPGQPVAGQPPVNQPFPPTAPGAPASSPFPPQPAAGAPGAPPPFPGQTAPMSTPPGQPMPPAQPMAGQPSPMPPSQPPAFPSAPVGTPNYPPPVSAPAPMPGWGGTSAQPQPMQPQGPPTQPYPQTQQYPPQQYQPQAMPMGNPYAGSQYRPPAGRRRTGEEPVFRVVHDHARITDTNYFDTFCGALLSVSGTNLTFTSGAAEGAVVIPMADIVEIRVNSLLGKETGLFHIITREGLYLSLAPESQDRDQARQLIEAISTRLGITE